MTVIEAAQMAGFSERTGHKRLRRFREEGLPGLRDRSSQPRCLASCHELGVVVEALGRRRRGQAAVRIAVESGVPRSTVGFWLRRAGTSQPASLREKEPPNRYEQEARIRQRLAG
jgi:transposase